jgi:hypothetical protein
MDAGAFFFGDAGVAVNSDGSLFDGTGAAVSSDGSLFDGAGAAVSSDGSLFDGTGAAVSSDGSLFDGTGADVSSGGLGRGNGSGNERSRCRLPSVPVTRVNQLEKSCAISARGDRPPVWTCDGACALTEAAARARKNRAIASAFNCVIRTTFPVKPPNGRRYEFTRNWGEAWALPTRKPAVATIRLSMPKRTCHGHRQ